MLPRLVALLLFLLLFVGLLLFALLGLRSLTLLVLDLSAACKLVPHLAGALHEVLILDLLEPPLVEIGQPTALITLLLRISFGRPLVLDDLEHGHVLDRPLPKLGLLFRVERFLRSFAGKVVLVGVGFFFSELFFEGLGSVEADQIFDGTSVAA